MPVNARHVLLTRPALESNYCWLAELPEGVPEGDAPDRPSRSSLSLLEDQIKLGPAHALHEDIRKLGGGRYSHWGRRLYFSTSDNSSPLENGRSYTLLIGVHGRPNQPFLSSVDFARRAAKRIAAVFPKPLRRLAARQVASCNSPNAAPINFKSRSVEQIREDVDYAVQVTTNWLRHLAAIGVSPEGKRILELGPGVNLAPQLVMASMGAEMSVADRFLVPWDDDYHPAFYRAFRQLWRGPAAAIDTVLRSGGHSPKVISCLASPAEELSAIATGSIDVVISNAVLEHVYSIPLVCREMARITVPGGTNLHQIDFRDHRDFARPLEFLTMPDEKFQQKFDWRHGECGNRWRPSEVRLAFEQAGFSTIAMDANMQADPGYFQKLLPRLRASSSRYRNWPTEDLLIISALLKLKRNETLSQF